ncbi:hypothetical protein BH20BAC1_BH20BAC1_10990 [soil metagenome]
MKRLISTAFFLSIVAFMSAQQAIPLYDGKIPNSKKYVTEEKWLPRANGDTIVSNISVPTLTVFLPQDNGHSKAAVIICPGGGYWRASIVKEGFAIAREFNKNGIAAFVLKYRVPEDSAMENKSVVPLQDAQRAIQLVRTNADKWKLDTGKIGIMGFSAGGHVASTASTHFSRSMIDNPANTNLRPDFSILIYPVISFEDSVGHMGSRERLIGKNPGRQMIESFSNELQVNKKSPPAFLVHASDDKAVPVANSIRYYEALLKNDIPAELHIYKGGGHGFGMINPTTDDRWMESCIHWMKSMNLTGELSQ